jgi:hypothetical protein
LGGRKLIAMSEKPRLRKNPLFFPTGIVIAFVLAAIVLAFLVYRQSKAFFSTYDVTEMEGIAVVNTVTPGLDEQGLPVPTTDPALEPLSGSAPVKARQPTRGRRQPGYHIGHEARFWRLVGRSRSAIPHRYHDP